MNNTTESNLDFSLTSTIRNVYKISDRGSSDVFPISRQFKIEGNIKKVKIYYIKIVNIWPTKEQLKEILRGGFLKPNREIKTNDVSCIRPKLKIDKNKIHIIKKILKTGV